MSHRGSRHGYKVRDFRNEAVRKRVEQVAALVNEATSVVGRGRGDCIILEDLGGTLSQAAWHDETGYFLTFRMHPLDAHSDKVKAAAKQVVAGFLEMFEDDNPFRIEYHIQDPGTDEHEAGGLDAYIDTGAVGKMTVTVWTNTYSIGD